MRGYNKSLGKENRKIREERKNKERKRRSKEDIMKRR